jgi:hypothetical protein
MRWPFASIEGDKYVAPPCKVRALRKEKNDNVVECNPAIELLTLAPTAYGAWRHDRRFIFLG